MKVPFRSFYLCFPFLGILLIGSVIHQSIGRRQIDTVVVNDLDEVNAKEKSNLNPLKSDKFVETNSVFPSDSKHKKIDITAEWVLHGFTHSE